MALRYNQDASNIQGVKIADTPEVLEIIREEQITPFTSATNSEHDHRSTIDKTNRGLNCNCDLAPAPTTIKVVGVTPEEVSQLLVKNEALLQKEFETKLEEEINNLKDRFDFILSNEQVRASHMLREAHRERQEKVTALQAQLQCKNLAGLMYVMCAERRRSKLERLRLIEEYTSYIRALQDVLSEAQDLILHLSRGYKTAARVDHEWRNKMMKIVAEFMSFVYHYAGGPPESNQYFFDLPALLKTEAPIVDNPHEDPCEKPDDQTDEDIEYQEPTWWESLDSNQRPFVVFGDMADFKPDRRRETLRAVKAAKTAPPKWKQYVFHDMFLKDDCPNLDAIKDIYPTKLPPPDKWVCEEVSHEPENASKTSVFHRATAHSIDMRGNMGSILKIITANAMQQAPKATILAARDSMEIQSATRLREKGQSKHHGSENIVLNIGKRKTSIFDKTYEDFEFNEESSLKVPKPSLNDIEDAVSEAGIGSLHNDSLQVTTHTPDQDHRINYEKICPMEICQRRHMDSFMRSLPAYMQSSPYTVFEQTFENYETCTPEQLELLKNRIEAKKLKAAKSVIPTDPLLEWVPSIQGIATQTSGVYEDLPPCTCPKSDIMESEGMVFNVQDLLPIKQVLESIQKAYFFDDTIEFDRFKVVGEDTIKPTKPKIANEDFAGSRNREIAKILKKHPSLLDIFQANTRC